jgi:hypothetical protein
MCTSCLWIVVNGNPDAVLYPEISFTVTSLCDVVPSFRNEVFESAFHVYVNETVIYDVPHPALVATLSFFLMLVKLGSGCQVEFPPGQFIPLS